MRPGISTDFVPERLEARCSPLFIPLRTARRVLLVLSSLGPLLFACLIQARVFYSERQNHSFPSFATKSWLVARGRLQNLFPAFPHGLAKQLSMHADLEIDSWSRVEGRGLEQVPPMSMLPLLLLRAI